MCTVTKKKEMLFLMYASILQKYYMDNLPSVMQHKKKKKKKPQTSGFVPFVNISKSTRL